MIDKYKMREMIEKESITLKSLIIISFDTKIKIKYSFNLNLF